MNSWIVFCCLAARRKSTMGLTRRGRVLAGSKGLGRLAALRAGKRAVIQTRPISEPHLEHRIILNWSEFENVDAVEDVEIGVDDTQPRAGRGERN